MSASFDAEFTGIHDRLSRVERRARRTARKTADIPGLSRETRHLASKIDDVNAAVEYLDDTADVIEEKLDGMYVRFDSVDAKLNADHELLVKIATALHIQV
jgi:hypothetical protein